MHIQQVFLLCFSLLHLSLQSQGQSIKKLDNSKETMADMDTKIESLMDAAKVHGLAVAIFNKNKPVYKKTFGYKNFQTACGRWQTCTAAS